MRIAIVDDDAAAAHVLAATARRRGHNCIELQTLADIERVRFFEPTVCVASYDLVSMSDVETLRTATNSEYEPIVILTAERMSEPERMEALRGQVVDIINKPYQPAELLTRAEIHLSRGQFVDSDSDSVSFGDLAVSLGRYHAEKNGVELSLTRLELRLLYSLVANAGHVTTTDKLLSFGWEGLDDYPNPSLLKTHVSHLRKKLRNAGGDEIQIMARHRLGYLLASPA